jgi:hypothetical protein
VRSGLILVFVVAVMSSGAVVAPEGCFWAGRAYRDGDLLASGGTCQICNDGKWIDKDVACAVCKTGDARNVFPTPPRKLDCVALDKSGSAVTFTDGARLIRPDGKTQRCSAGQWVDNTIPNDQRCRETERRR